MGNFFSFSQCCGCKTRPTSIFGIPKKKFSKHTVLPLMSIHINKSSTFDAHKNTYSTTPPYFIEDRTL
jgi:hypothetical protein